MLVELSRFKIKPGKEARVDEWLAMLNGRMAEAKQTLVREKMKLEVIFREKMGGDEYLTWFSMQDETGAPVASSPFDVDREHLKFHDECIDHDYGRHDAQAQVVLVPDAVASALGWANPAAAAVPFRRKEIVYRRTR
jgi:hypothetical protein